MKKSLLLLSSVALLLASASASGQKKWKQKEKRFEPVVKEDVRAYAGRYLGADDEHWLDVRFDDTGRLTATLVERGREIALRDVRLEGARLTATKVDEDGRALPFAGTFADRVLNGQRTFGILVEGPVEVADGVTLERLFYRLR